jgi:signal transduction histidine kinase
MLPLFKSTSAADAEVSRRALEATEQIIEEMGAEIHDDLIQRLSILRLYLDRLDRAKGDPVTTDSLITSMNADFLDVVESVRRISRRLLPTNPATDSLENRLRTLCQNMERPGIIRYSQTGSEPPIPSRDSIHIYRIVQELIHNAFKHSSAWHVDIRIEWKGPSLIIEVEDDGVAFSKVDDYIQTLKVKNNTLRMRSSLLQAPIAYGRGKRGLLAHLSYRVNNR